MALEVLIWTGGNVDVTAAMLISMDLPQLWGVVTAVCRQEEEAVAKVGAGTANALPSLMELMCGISRQFDEG